jgi:hypothetical protein
MLALSDTDVWVFGGSGAQKGTGTWHYDGHTWTQATGLANTIETASAVSPTDIYGIAAKVVPADTVVHFNGSTWQAVSSPFLAAPPRRTPRSGPSVRNAKPAR